MTQSAYFGAGSGTENTDLRKIKSLKPDHVVSSIRVCTDADNLNVLGVQIFYAQFGEDGRIMNEMRMEPHGLTNDNQIVACQIVDLVEGEYLSGIGFGFTSTDLIQFIYKSSFKQTLAYGGVSEKTL